MCVCWLNTSVDMAPEVMSGQTYYTAADMFSFGLLLFEVFSGSHPFAHLFNNRKSSVHTFETNTYISARISEGNIRGPPRGHC